MNFTVLSAGSTNHGFIRSNNEDNFYFSGKYMSLGTLDIETILFDCGNTSMPVCIAVFDGMGGENAGEQASFTAAGTFFDCVRELSQIIKIPKSFLCETCQRMNRAVVSHAQANHLGQTGTTAAVLYLWQDMAYVCNVGDSVIFRLRGNELKQLTRSHTNEEFLKRNGLTGRKPSLTQFIGIPEDEMIIEPYLAKGQVLSGDRFLICTDGLTDMVPVKQIADCLYRSSTVEAAAGELLNMALQAGGRDNITVFVCEIQG